MGDVGSFSSSLVGTSLCFPPSGGKIYVGGVEVADFKHDGFYAASFLIDSPTVMVEAHSVTLAEMNAGHTLLAARAGYKYRLVDAKMISIGGAMEATSAATGAAIYGTQSDTETALYTVLLAAGTENAVCTINTANTSVATAGAFYAANDANTAITCKAVSAGDYDLITATSFTVVLSYTVEEA